MRTLTVFMCLLAGVAASVKVVNYKFAEGNANAINECVNGAIEKFRRLTCVQFRYQPTISDAISVVDSGHVCSYFETNKTILISKKCINEEDTCQRLVAQAIANERIYTNPIRHLNLKYNCTDKCTTNCQNGGQMNDACQCSCGNFFGGETCEQLTSLQDFTDPKCGIVTDKEGLLSLSNYPNSAPKGTFCQWLIKAKEEETIEFEFADIDLNYASAHPGQKCADSFAVLGVRGFENPISCNKNDLRSIVKRHFQSDGNWVLFTLSTNNWSRSPHKGPVIKYRVISPQSNKEIRSFSNPYMNSTSSTFEFAHVFTSIVLTLFSLKLFF